MQLYFYWRMSGFPERLLLNSRARRFKDGLRRFAGEVEFSSVALVRPP
jgi:hypothetical protein